MIRLTFAAEAAQALTDTLETAGFAWCAVSADIALTPGKPKEVPYRPGGKLNVELQGRDGAERREALLVTLVALDDLPSGMSMPVAEGPQHAGGFAWLLRVQREATRQ